MNSELQFAHPCALVGTEGKLFQSFSLENWGNQSMAIWGFCVVYGSSRASLLQEAQQPHNRFSPEVLHPMRWRPGHWRGCESRWRTKALFTKKQTQRSECKHNI